MNFMPFILFFLVFMVLVLMDESITLNPTFQQDNDFCFFIMIQLTFLTSFQFVIVYKVDNGIEIFRLIVLTEKWIQHEI